MYNFSTFWCNLYSSSAFILTRVARDECIYASARTLVGPQCFNSARFVLPPHLSTIVGLPARPNELQTRKTFGVCRTLLPQCTCIDGPFRPHFAGARAKGKRSFRTNLQRLASFRTLGAPISDLTTDLSDISADLWLKPRARFAWSARWTMKQLAMVFARRACFKHETHTIWKLEQYLEQVPQPVQTSCGGLAKLLAPRKWERSSVLDPRQSKRSGFHSRAAYMQCRFWVCKTRKWVWYMHNERVTLHCACYKLISNVNNHFGMRKVVGFSPT